MVWPVSVKDHHFGEFIGSISLTGKITMMWCYSSSLSFFGFANQGVQTHAINWHLHSCSYSFSLSTSPIMDNHVKALGNVNVRYACGVQKACCNKNISLSVHGRHVNYHRSNMTRRITKSVNEYPTTSWIFSWGLWFICGTCIAGHPWTGN